MNVAVAVSQPRATVDELVREYMPYARIVAKRIIPRLPPFIEKEDLFSAAYVGLWQAAQRYDPSKNTCFRSYSHLRIRGSILSWLRRQQKHHGTSQLDLKAAANDKTCAKYTTASFDLVDDIDYTQVRKEVRRAIAALPEGVRKVVQMRSLAGQTSEQAARVLKVPEVQVNQVQKAAIETLRNSRTIQELVVKKPVGEKAKVISIDVLRRKAVVDELGPLQESMKRLSAELKPLATRGKELIEEVLRWPKVDGVGEAQPTSYQGKLFQANLSACQNERTVAEMTAVKKVLGDAVFMKQVSITLGKLDALLKTGLLTKAQHEKLISEAREGVRTVACERLAEEAAA